MVVDTSAIVSVIEAEAGWQHFFDAMAEAPRLSMSTATWVELGIVAIARLRPGAEDEAATLCEDLDVQLAPLDLEQSLLAREAFRRFGRGRHRAGLNLGDCFAYALARQRNEPLLFKDDDFAHTDIEPALRA